MCTRINRTIQLLCTYTLIEYVFDYTSFITLILLVYQKQPPTDDTIFFPSIPSQFLLCFNTPNVG